MLSFKFLLRKKWSVSLTYFIAIICFYTPEEAAVHKYFFIIGAATKIGFLLCKLMD